MPAIRACGRRLHIATDDFFFPGICSVIVRLVWLVLTAFVVYFYVKEGDPCGNNDSLLVIYLYGALGVTFAVGLLDTAITWISGRGTITDGQPRRRIPCLLVVRIVLAVPELAWLILGSIWVWNAKFHGALCPKRDLTLVSVSVISAWVVHSSLGLFFICFVDWLGSSKIRRRRRENGDNSSSDLENSIDLRQEAWERRCNLFCCCMFCNKKKDPDYRATMLEVTKLFALFFSDKSDLVPTDIAAGFLLVGEQQREEKRRKAEMATSAGSTHACSAGEGDTAGYGPCIAWQAPTSTNDQCIDRPSCQFGEINMADPANQAAYEPVNHFMKFAMGPYGWPLFVFESLLTGCCKLMPYCQCCVGCSSDAVIDSDCPGCHCNTAAVLNWTGIHCNDIIYAKFDGDLLHLPFFVAIDHSHKSVVVSVRGTMSLQDALTDLRAAPQAMGLDQHPEFKAHDGIFRSACNIRERMRHMQLLEQAFERVSHLGTTYDLVFVGHSLGAGTASLLAILYRAEYPSLRCFAYSPPGALVDKECMEFSAEFTVSVVLGDDVVPRLGFASFEDLRVEIMDALYKSRQSKPAIFCTACCSTVCSCLPCCQHLNVDDEAAVGDGGRNVPATSIGTARQSEPLLLGRAPNPYTITPATQPISTEPVSHGSVDVVDEERHGRTIFYTDYKLYPPGRIMHLAETEEQTGCFGSRTVWKPYWVSYDAMQTILAGGKMLTHHLPNHVRAALEEVSDASSNTLSL